MPHLFSPSTLAFYHTEVPYLVLPEDVNEVTDELHEAIMESLLLHGKVLQADSEGAPRAAELSDGPRVEPPTLVVGAVS